VILAASEVVDVTLIATRLNAFATVHRAYTEAQRLVETAETQLRAGQTKVAERDADQDEALEKLAVALVNDGQPRTNPFAAFGAESPSIIKQLNVAEEAKAIHKLVDAVQADPTVSKKARRAAQLADEAARQTETELVPIDKLQASLRTARDARETAGTAWDTELAALKRRARSAADEGAPALYKALFGSLSRPKKKPDTPTPSSPVANAA
jgi:hypothetical protein